MTERRKFLLYAGVFLLVWFLPVDSGRFARAVNESLALTRWYAREHVLLCLVPAFFIAGAIATFISQASVIRYLGARANRLLAYGVASVSGSVLAVCSCTVLPLFAGIYSRGAGLGPATAFLYAGPAVNVLAIILTARVLGADIGIARALGAIVFSVVIGVVMQLLFREERDGTDPGIVTAEDGDGRPLWQEAAYFALMIAILVVVNWGAPGEGSGVAWIWLFQAKWAISGVLVLLLGLVIWRWFTGEELRQWGASSWEYAAMIMPLLLAGVLAAGLLLGRPGGEGLIPTEWVARLVGGNSWTANLFASVVGAFMYFATLTEVPILEGLIGAGMGKGPALALLLAGPALSLPNMLVIRGVLGTKKTLVYVLLVIVMATISGIIGGALLS